MPEKVSRFLDSVCACVRCKPMHQEIRDELAVHIHELAETFANEAPDAEAALDMALTAMGDCDEIGRHLDKRHRPQTERPLVALTGVIAVMGGVAMYASSRNASTQAVDFGRYLVFALLGAGLVAALYFFDYTKLKKLSLPVYIAATTLTFASAFPGMPYVGWCNGSRYFMIGGLMVAMEMLVPVLLLSFAGIVDESRGRGERSVIKLLSIAAVPVAAMLPQRFSYTFALMAGCFVLITAAVARNHFGGERKRQLLFLGTAACLTGVALFAAIGVRTYRVQRIVHFLSRVLSGQDSDPVGLGYQQAVALHWLRASRLFGAATETFHGYTLDAVMPFATTHYALLNLIATLGWVAGVALILSIAAFIGRLCMTARRIKNGYGFFLCLGVCTLLSWQFLTGVLVNLNLSPVMGVYIPFISYGGTEYIISMALVGLVLSVWRRNHLIPAGVEGFTPHTSML